MKDIAARELKGHNILAVHKAWRDKKLTLKEAAEACDLPVGTFYGKSIQFEKST